MAKAFRILKDYVHSESGATAIEYGLIAALIALGIITGASSMTSAINSMFTNVNGDIATAFSSP